MGKKMSIRKKFEIQLNENRMEKIKQKIKKKYQELYTYIQEVKYQEDDGRRLMELYVQK